MNICKLYKTKKKNKTINFFIAPKQWWFKNFKKQLFVNLQEKNQFFNFYTNILIDHNGIILGDWINIFVHMKKQLGSEEFRNIAENRSSSFKWSEITLESLLLQNLWSFWLSSCLVSYGLYLGIGGFLHVSTKTINLQCI